MVPPLDIKYNHFKVKDTKIISSNEHFFHFLSSGRAFTIQSRRIAEIAHQLTPVNMVSTRFVKTNEKFYLGDSSLEVAYHFRFFK